MDLASSLILVNLILTAFTAIATPIVIAVASCITRVKHSDCCGNNIEIEELREFKRRHTENNLNKN
jgi:hypothetical protein